MWNFNNVGRIVSETELHRGLVARLTKVWPWKRKELSGGMKYLVTVTNPQGIEIYNHYHSHKVLFGYVVSNYEAQVNPLKSWHDEVDVHAFSLNTAVETYLSRNLSDGTYLIMIPLNKKVSETFWKAKADEVSMNHEDPHLDCYVANVSGYEGVLSHLIADSYSMYPGRYMLMIIKDGFAQSTEDLL
jgi:hypothetical protein